MDPTPAPAWARGFSFNTFDLMSAHVKLRIATHFAYPLEPAKRLGGSGSAMGSSPGSAQKRLHHNVLGTALAAALLLR